MSVAGSQRWSLPGIARRKTRVNALVTRQSILFAKGLFANWMDARVKPGHDGVTGAGRAKRPRRWLWFGLAAVVIATVSVLSAGAWWIASLGPAPLGEGLAFSTLVVDRDGKLLRPYTTPEGRWRIPASREKVDPRFLELLLAYEDKRFNVHHGIDPLALGRALAQLITHGRIVSG